MRTILLVSLLLLGISSQSAYAEGSYQTGLNQQFADYTSGTSPLYVDILSIGEVINVSLCGNANTDDVRVRLFDPDGVSVLDTTLTDGNVTCTDTFTAPLTNPVRHTTTKTGAYQVRLDSVASSYLQRFDVSVTPDALTNPDPTVVDGRMWAYKFAFNAGAFTELSATDADYYPLVPGGRSGTSYVWKLDLNKFAGNVYDLVANDLGVAAPNSGYSVPTSGNSVVAKFPIYVGYPDVALPRPVDPPVITDFRFLDNAGQDYGISPGNTTGVQDSGTFEFTSDADGTYSITIDTNQDGVYGTGDKLLLGTVTAGPVSVSWNGTDAAGATLPAGTYRAQLRVRLGEYHFIANDAETSGGTYDGLTIYLANSNGTTTNTLVYWDDATLLTGTSNLPGGALSSTAAGKHTWGTFTSNSIGNNAYIDTYVYGLTSAASSITAITASDALLIGSDGTIGVTPAHTTPGGSFSITVTDADLNVINTVQETEIIVVTNPRTGEVEQISIAEAGVNSADFSGNFSTLANTAAGTNNDGTMNVQLGDVLTVSYFDQLDSSSASVTRTANITISDGDLVPANIDLDDDNDGIPDSQEGDGLVDTDGDGIVDSLDLDSDNDGLSDLYESGIANPATLDTNNDGRIDASFDVGANGLADIAETAVDSGTLNYNGGFVVDTDGDGVRDFRDLDSDNDGLPDVLESGGSDPDHDGVLGTGIPTVDGNGLPAGGGLTPVDTDNDGIPDQRELDADNDSVFDLVEAGGTDANNDGMVDGFVDSNNDGFDDGIAATPLPLPDGDGDSIPDYRDNDDADGDGVPDTADLDDDNDGIPDALEGDRAIDTDGDGLPDSLDLDSDNDGLFDLYESGITNSAALDVNNDGRIDSTYAVGTNGLANIIETSTDSGVINYNNGTTVDTDNDGIADFRDLDSDNDGIPDVLESGGSDPDGDGVIGTGVPSVNTYGVPTGGGLLPTDSDADGAYDFRDLDADNDGVYDLIEAGGVDADNDGRVDGFTDVNGDGFDDGIAAAPLTLPDSDNDGIPDYKDAAAVAATAGIRTGLKGIGAVDSWLLIMLLPLLLLTRAGNKKKLLLLAMVIPGIASAESDDEFKRRVYVGAGAGLSIMDPDTGSTVYSLDDDRDFGYRLYLGYDWNRVLSVDLALANLGTATLQPAGEVDYSIASASVLFYFYDQGDNDHVGLAAYVKGGVGSIQNDATVPYERVNSFQIAYGIGAEYGWANGFAARLDLETYDEDASLITAGLLYRFGGEKKQETVISAPPQQQDADKDGVLDAQDQCPDTAANTKVDDKGCSQDDDNDGVVNAQDKCPNTVAGAAVNAEGCAVFETRIEGVNFKPGSADLTDNAKAMLDKVVVSLASSSAVRIEVQAHTDNVGKELSNQKLSEARAKSVVVYLTEKGIAEDRMVSVGYGESQPIADNKTEAGLAKNRRVEFRVINAAQP